MTGEKLEEFGDKFCKVVGRTTKHYEFREDALPDYVLDWIEAYVKEEMKNFAEYCHERYKGSVRDNNGKSLYQYDDEVVWLLDEFLLYTHGSSI